MKKFFIPIAYACLLLLSASCKHKESKGEDEEVSAEDVQTPVTVTSISSESLVDSLELNATSAFVQDNIVKSNINGYIKSVYTRIGQYTPAGKVLFVLKTKEAESLGNTINKLDPSFHFSGVVSIKASQSGYITQLDHQAGDYVQDGEQLATISDSKSFGFILNTPYEYKKYVRVGKQVDVVLPDGTLLKGVVSSMLPSIDSVSQTQTAMIRVSASMPIPENLVAKVRLVKNAKSGTITVPKDAVLTDESQSSFWVMKMIDSVKAVKVPIIKGMETKDRIEVLSPKFTPSDKILVSGNYGLPDTARVKIVKAQDEE